MSLELDPEAVRLFVTFRHPSLSPRWDVPPRADPEAVAVLASNLMVKVLGGFYDGDQCQVASCSGLLIYAMDGYGLTYEEVCKVACRRVAEVLRQVTPDHRQTDPKRYLALASNLGQADALTAVVKLAEILAVITRIPLEYDQEQLASRALDIKNWADRVGHLLKAMAPIRDLPRMQTSLARARDGLVRVLRLAEEAKVQQKAHAAANRPVPARRLSPHLALTG